MRGRPNRDRPAPVQLLPPCGVCGQKAAGFHYGVTTCEACKGFFRRSLLRTKPYDCVQTRQCRIGSSTARRQSCPKCRYDKCISVGMSKDAIKTGRYSLLKKSKDIYDLLQSQQSSSTDTLDEELRVKAKQTLEKITKAKRRGRAKYCADFPPVFFNTTKSELDLSSSPPQNHFTKAPDKITNSAPSSELNGEVNNAAKTPIQHEAFPTPQSTPFSSSSMDDITYHASKKSMLPGDVSHRYNSLSHAHRHEWNQTLPVSAGANSPGYQYQPIICQCMQRHTGFYPNSTAMDYPPSYNPETCENYNNMREHQPRLHPGMRAMSSSASSLEFINDGPGANWTGNPYIHPKENSRTKRVLDTYHNLPRSRQMADYHSRFHSNRFHNAEDQSSFPLTRYLYRNEQDDSLHSLKSPRERPDLNEKGQMSPYAVSETIMDSNCPVKAEPISPQSQYISNRPQHRMSEVKQELHDGKNGNNVPRFSYRYQGETDHPNTKVSEMTFEKLIARSIAGEDNWGGYGSYNDNDKDDKDVGIDHINKQNTDTSHACASDSSDGHSGYDTMNYGQEEDNLSNLKSGTCCADSTRLDLDDNESRQMMKNSERNTLLPSGKSDDILFSIFDMPRFIAGTNTFEHPFVEACLSYEKVLKSILGNCSGDRLMLERDTILNPEGIRSAKRSLWERVLSEVMESSTSADNSLPQQINVQYCPTLSTQSAFSEENLEGSSLSDYDIGDLEEIISGLIRSHEENIGPDSNYLSDRQVQTALNVFQSLRRLKQELLRPYHNIDPVNIWNSPNLDVDFGRDMVSRYSLRSNKSLPKVLMYYRSVPGFRNLSTADKVTLVRGAITEFLFLSSLRGLDHKTMTLVDAINLMTIDLSTMSFAFPLFGELSATMLIASQEIKHLKLSKDILIVLKAISLMTPDRPNLENPEQVKQMYKPLHACLQLLLKKQYGESSVVYDKIGTLFHTMQLSIVKFKEHRDDNLKKLVEDIHVPLIKETVFHFLFE